MRVLDVNEFCRETCAGAEAWVRDISNDAAAQARLSLLLKSILRQRQWDGERRKFLEDRVSDSRLTVRAIPLRT